jgi:hypothetical protein
MISEKAIQESDKCEYKNGHLFIDGQPAFVGMVIEAFNEIEDVKGVGEGKWSQARIIEFDSESVTVAFNTHRFIFGLNVAAIKRIKPVQPQPFAVAPPPEPQFAPQSPGPHYQPEHLDGMTYDSIYLRLNLIESRLSNLEHQISLIIRHLR